MSGNSDLGKGYPKNLAGNKLALAMLHHEIQRHRDSNYRWLDEFIREGEVGGTQPNADLTAEQWADQIAAKFKNPSKRVSMQDIIALKEDDFSAEAMSILCTLLTRSLYASEYQKGREGPDEFEKSFYYTFQGGRVGDFQVTSMFYSLERGLFDDVDRTKKMSLKEIVQKLLNNPNDITNLSPNYHTPTRDTFDLFIALQNHDWWHNLSFYNNGALVNLIRSMPGYLDEIQLDLNTKIQEFLNKMVGLEKASLMMHLLLWQRELGEDIPGQRSEYGQNLKAIIINNATSYLEYLKEDMEKFLAEEPANRNVIIKKQRSMYILTKNLCSVIFTLFNPAEIYSSTDGADRRFVQAINSMDFGTNIDITNYELPESSLSKHGYFANIDAFTQLNELRQQARNPANLDNFQKIRIQIASDNSAVMELTHRNQHNQEVYPVAELKEYTRNVFKMLVRIKNRYLGVQKGEIKPIDDTEAEEARKFMKHLQTYQKIADGYEKAMRPPDVAEAQR